MKNLLDLFKEKKENKTTNAAPALKLTLKTRIQTLMVAMLALFAFAPVSNAMHVMEGYLPLGWCVFWYAVCIPFVVLGFIGIRKIVENDRKAITLLAITGAFVFVISSLKIPSVTGSCSHNPE